MTAATGHACRSRLEASVCAEMVRQKLPHEHRSLRFRVQGADGNHSKFSPAIVAHRGPILFLVEPLQSARTRRTLERLTDFLEQHSPEIVLVVVAPDATVSEFPREMYDEIYAASDIATMTRRIRTQNPEGIVVPFDKPKPRTASPRDTTK